MAAAISAPRPRAAPTPIAPCMCGETDDGGRSFAAPVTLLAGQYSFDAPWIAAGAGRTPSERNVYVVWASNGREGGDSVAMTRSTDGGAELKPPRTILTPDGPRRRARLRKSSSEHTAWYASRPTERVTPWDSSVRHIVARMAWPI